MATGLSVTTNVGARVESTAAKSRPAMLSGGPVTARPNTARCNKPPGWVPTPNRMVGSSRFVSSSFDRRLPSVAVRRYGRLVKGGGHVGLLSGQRRTLCR
jgi:hypothetical protein